MTPEAALSDLRTHAQDGKAEEMRAYHKADREYLGVANPDIDNCTKAWRKALDVPERVALARDLWATDIHEARVAAAKLLTQARLRPDEEAWELIQSWVPDFNAWAIADHACIAGQKRLVADPTRLDEVEPWIASDHMWTRRAAFVITLPWTKQNFPKPAEIEARERVLGWAATLVEDKEWFIQKAISWWLRDLSKHDVPRAQAFLNEYGPRLKPFAQKEATRHMRDYTVPPLKEPDVETADAPKPDEAPDA
ncbi:DNA alkylation repair protein [Halocynthiibacter sp. C4]|uniref:DNA alkylation repair protein n=1 Tax=Halocynthiibacter sp. C4 TaxID=2992758 RepID=UPI00237BD695|nr:DNA alkylation repair protein [Halocynthiibacter sp. C4]MDE0589241.1 DNA alkylation repair protein [Halocynthiibacter sp. C4]